MQRPASLSAARVPKHSHIAHWRCSLVEMAPVQGIRALPSTKCDLDAFAARARRTPVDSAAHAQCVPSNRLQVQGTKHARFKSEQTPTCPSCQLRYWLGGDSGTLLGAVRSQSFVPFDNDVDVEVHPDDLTRFRDMLDQPGFRIPDLPDDLFMQTRHNSPTWSRLLPEVHPLYVKLRDLHRYRCILPFAAAGFHHSSPPSLRVCASCYRLNAPSDYKEGYQLDMFARAPEGTFPLIECEIDGVPYPCPANWRDRLNLEVCAAAVVAMRTQLHLSCSLALHASACMPQFGPNWHIPTPPRLNDGTDKDGYQPSAWIGC